MINTGVGVALIAVATLCTAVMIGLGFLARPSRATAIWSFAFTITMIGSYGWVAADAVDSLPLRAACAGALLGANAMVWVGLRARRGARRVFWMPALVYAVVSPTVLALTAESPYYSAVFRLDFAVAAVVAGLTIAELVRLGSALRDVVLPLALASGAYVVFSIVSLIDGALQFARTGTIAAVDGLVLVRNLNSIGSLVFVVSALITLLLLARQSSAQPELTGSSSFRSVATDRLTRAGTGDDSWWAVLDIRLDDPVDLREATSSDTFAVIAERFAANVRATVPADADIERRSDTGFVVLLPRPEGSVRQVMSRLLAAVATPDADLPVTVRMSASIGWASVEAVGYELDDLLRAAGEAASVAAADGGDRWERAVGAGGVGAQRPSAGAQVVSPHAPGNGTD